MIGDPWSGPLSAEIKCGVLYALPDTLAVSAESRKIDLGAVPKWERPFLHLEGQQMRKSMLWNFCHSYRQSCSNQIPSDQSQKAKKEVFSHARFYLITD